MEATARKRLEKLKGKIKQNTYRTIVGQIKSGNVEGAMVGIKRLENRCLKSSNCANGMTDGYDLGVRE